MNTVTGQKIYETAKSLLGTHLTLNENVPPELGCAEALSTVLKKAGVNNIPIKGFEGTRQMYDFLLNGNFALVTYPMAGDIIISPTPQKGKPHGHCGVVAKYGILSNDSDTGLWLERFSLTSWERYYQEKLGLMTYYFRAI